jgi:hypothetical protein
LFLLFSATGSFGANFSATIFNGSKNTVLTDYPVTVRVTEKSRGPSSSRQTFSEFSGRTNSQGIFEGEISAPAGKIITAEINYRGIPYFSRPEITDDRRQHYALNVEGFEITSNYENVSIPTRTMTITPIDEKTLEVYDSLQVANSGDSTYVGAFNDEKDLSQVLYIPVPVGYRLRGIQTGADASKIRTLGRAIISQKEVKPGNNQITMRYLVVSDIGFFDLSLFSEKDTPGVEELNLYFPKSSNWSVKQSTLKQAGEETLRNTSYKKWKGKPGSVLRLKAYNSIYTGGFNFWHVSIILAFLATTLCLFLLRKKINHWYLRLEEKKLKRLQNLINSETEDQELAAYYQPLKLVLENRIQETNQTIKGG